MREGQWESAEPVHAKAQWRQLPDIRTRRLRFHLLLFAGALATSGACEPIEGQAPTRSAARRQALSAPATAPAAAATQTPLDPAAIAKFAEPLPTFVGARIDGTATVSVSMEEFQQRVLPADFYAGLPSPYNDGTYVWGYKVNNSGPHWPAFTIESKRNVATTVIYTNNLQKPDGSPPTLQQYVTVDQTIHWADPLRTSEEHMCMMGPPLDPECLVPYAGPVPAAPHLHGGEVWSGYDGGPLSWFTPGLALRGSAFLSSTYNYNNQQESGTLWFHDHALGATRTNVYSGLAGFYLLRDTRDTGLVSNPIRLPAGAYEIELAIQDRQFDTNGQLIFPDGRTPGLSGPPPNPDVHPYWIPEFFGDVMVVNGKTWPFLQVEPRRYRLRMLDGCNARFLALRLVDASSGGPGPAIWQIGTDGGLLDSPVKLNDPANPAGLKLALAPGERADLIIDFTGMQGRSFTLTNSANAPFPDGDSPDANSGQVMQFRVNLPLQGRDMSYDPASPRNNLRSRPIVRLDPAVTRKTPDMKRQLMLVEVTGEGGPLEVLVNNTKYPGKREGTETPVPGSVPVPDGSSDYATEAPQVGATEVWDIVNLTMDAHPMHLHLVQFQLLSRQTFDADAYRATWDASFPGGSFLPGYGPPLDYNTPNGAGARGGNPDVTPYLQGSATGPDANEYGWKDTIKAFPGEVTRIVVRWAPQSVPACASRPGLNQFPFDPSSGPGYVWHCHIIDHEDNEMMRPYVVAR